LRVAQLLHGQQAQLAQALRAEIAAPFLPAAPALRELAGFELGLVRPLRGLALPPTATTEGPSELDSALPHSAPGGPSPAVTSADTKDASKEGKQGVLNAVKDGRLDLHAEGSAVLAACSDRLPPLPRFGFLYSLP
jgi:hypothetical protein